MIYKQKTKLMSTKTKFIVIAVILISTIGLAFTVSMHRITEKKYISIIPIKKDSVTSVAAFKQVYKVLMSPRCVNCHPIGDIPLQGDNSVVHSMQPKRGKDGKGLYAMKCANCHQESNSPGLHTPPGNPDWHLPPADMKMVFEAKSAHELAKQLVNPELNGHKDLQKLIEHADDGLVKAGWNPGKGRTVPPLTHAQFKKAWITWLQTGAYAPAK